jgi:hypothetical protein
MRRPARRPSLLPPDRRQFSGGTHTPVHHTSPRIPGKPGMTPDRGRNRCPPPGTGAIWDSRPEHRFGTRPGNEHGKQAARRSSRMRTGRSGGWLRRVAGAHGSRCVPLGGCGFLISGTCSTPASPSWRHGPAQGSAWPNIDRSSRLVLPILGRHCQVVPFWAISCQLLHEQVGDVEAVREEVGGLG